MACLLRAKVSLLFKSLGRKWHRVQDFLKAQSEKGEFLGAKNKDNKQSSDSSLGLLMEILNAVDVATSIHSEGDPIQAAVAHHTGEAVGMVGLPSGSEDPFHDGLCTDTALLQCILQRKHTQQM